MISQEPAGDRRRSIGLIGTGNISQTHARAARLAGISIAAVFGRTAESAGRFAASYGGAPYSNLEAFLAHPGMTAVVIGTPSGTHADYGVAAAAKGLHVLVEKPIEISTERAAALIDAADRSGVKVGVCYQDRVAPDLRAVRDFVAGGRLGRLISARGIVNWYRRPEYYTGSSWRGSRQLDGGGALMNQGIHTVDLLLWLLGPIARVSGHVATRFHDIEVEDTAAAVLEFASGAVGVLEASTASYPGYPRRVELTGAGGTLTIEQNRLVGVDLRDKTDLQSSGAIDGSPGATSPVVSDATGHRVLLDDFFEAIAEDRAPCCDGREGRRSVAVVEAIYRSAREGAAVDVDRA